MRLFIKNCRNCPKSGVCDYKKSFSDYIKAIPQTETVCLNCPEYKKIFRVGDRVKIELYSQIIEDCSSYEYPDYKLSWESAGLSTGKIVNTPSNNKYRFFAIELDKPVTLSRIDRDRGGMTKDILITHYRKLAKDIELLDTK